MDVRRILIVEKMSVGKVNKSNCAGVEK